jgi:hypothetical protein
VSAAQGDLLNASRGLLGPYLQPQNFTMAPFNADQTGAFDLTRSLAMNAFGGGNYGSPQVAQQPAGQSLGYRTGVTNDPSFPMRAPQGPLPSWMDESGLGQGATGQNPLAAVSMLSGGQRFDNGAVGTAVNAGDAQAPANISPVGSAMTPGLPAITNYSERGIQASANLSPNLTTLNGKDYNYSPATGQAAQVTGDSIRALLNPYTQDVVDTSIATINRNANAQQAALGARYAAAGAFGGSRQALGSAQLARSTGEQVASTTAQLMAQGYDRATATALANAQMDNQMRLANMSAQNGASQFNAQMNYGAANQNNANQLQQYGLDINNFNSNQSAQQQQYNRQLQAIQALLGIGNQQQQYYNQAVQQPLTYLQLLGQLTPQNYGGTTVGTQPNTAQSPLQTLLGVGTSLAGLALRR